MPAGMSFVKLEGNYVISFRDMNEALPAFTAVKLDRRRGSWDGSGTAMDSTTSLSAAGAGPRRGSFSVGMSSSGAATPAGGGSLAGSRIVLGDDLSAAAAAANRRRSSLAVTPFKLVLTGVPRGVREDLIRSRLESVIDGIERVYRDPDMARNLSHPPVFVETMSALAQDAFMLRADWVPVVQRLVKEANAPEASADEGLGASFDVASSREAPDSDDVFSEEQRRRQSLVDTLVTCPHGRYHGQATCPLCRSGARRNTMVADDFLTHVADVPASPAPSVRAPAATSAATADAAPAAPSRKSSSSCPSCMACLRRFVPGMRRKAKAEAKAEPPPVPEIRAPDTDTGTFLDPSLLSAIKNQRRLSAYDDVPAIKVSDVPDIRVDHLV